jgi:acyl-CoA synthetase (NDP forming)
MTVLLNEVQSKNLLKKAGIKVTDSCLAFSKSEAVSISKSLEFPVVMKIVSPDIVHKSDVGGVKLDLKTEIEVEQAYDEIMADVAKKCPEAKILGVAVQQMASPGTEVIIGMTMDSQFGPTLMFGLGGIWVELLKDVSFRTVPVDQIDAVEMIKEIKGYKLLTGFRGGQGVDIRAIEDLILSVSDFIQANPQVKELDLNPVIVYPEGAVAVDARIVIDDNYKINPVEKTKQKTGSLDSLFYPGSVAVVGASNNPASRGYDFTQHLINFGYKGKIFPISLKSPEVMGIKAYPNLDAIQENIDHVIYCIKLENMPAFLESARRKAVKSIHIFSARGDETGRSDAKVLESSIKEQAKEYGIRLLGPNCMGVYCAETGFSFCADFSKEEGSLGAIIQSGGSSTDIAKYGILRGIKFSKLISYGNAIDINETELLRYLANDPKTKVIIMFIEGLRATGREFLDVLKKTTAHKPVIICKGGLSESGARVTMSHTASLAGSSTIWNIAVSQAGGVPVRDIDDLVNMATAFSLIPPIKGRRVGTGGSGGGRNTVSVDEWESKGFEIVPLPQHIREEFKRRGAVLWDCLDNPVDRSLTEPGDAFTVPALLEEMAKDPNYDFICANIAAEDHPFNQETFINLISNNVDGYIKLAKTNIKPFFTIFSERPLGTRDMDHWFWREVAKLRTSLIEAKIAFFPNVDKAAEAVNAIINYYQRKEVLKR